MKKIHSLFVLSILALTMFVGCQTPTNDTTPTNTTPTETPTEDPVDDTPTVDADETTYGFTKTVDYTVVANGQSLPESKTGAELIAIAKDKNLIKDTDYTIDGTTVSLTASGVKKFFGNTGDGNTSSDKTYSVDVSKNNESLERRNRPYRLAINNQPLNGYKEGDKVEVLITNGSYNASTGTWGTPDKPYIVETWINDEKRTFSDHVIATKDHKITFTMPDKDVEVHTEFFEVGVKESDESDYDLCVENLNGESFEIVLIGADGFGLGPVEPYNKDNVFYVDNFWALFGYRRAIEDGMYLVWWDSESKNTTIHDAVVFRFNIVVNKSGTFYYKYTGDSLEVKPLWLGVICKDKAIIPEERDKEKDFFCPILSDDSQ